MKEFRGVNWNAVEFINGVATSREKQKMVMRLDQLGTTDLNDKNKYDCRLGEIFDQWGWTN